MVGKMPHLPLLGAKKELVPAAADLLVSSNIKPTRGKNQSMNSDEIVDGIRWESANSFVARQTRNILREFRSSRPKPRPREMGLRSEREDREFRKAQKRELLFA